MIEEKSYQLKARKRKVTEEKARLKKKMPSNMDSKSTLPKINLLKEYELIYPKGKISFKKDELISLSNSEISVIVNKNKVTCLSVKILSLSEEEDKCIALGWTKERKIEKGMLPGWIKNTFGVHSDDGELHFGSDDPTQEIVKGFKMDKFRSGDVVTIGYNENKKFYFKLNNNPEIYPEILIANPSEFYPVIGFSGKSHSVKVIGITCDMGEYDVSATLLSGDEQLKEEPKRVTNDIQEKEIRPSELEFKEELGQGGFGIVYKGKYKNMTVAIKKLLTSDIKHVENFMLELNILKNLHHKNIVQYYGFCVSGERMIVMEYLKKDLKNYIESEGALRDEKWRKIAMGICKGMYFIHEQNLIHRDLKPSNILLAMEGDIPKPKIADFGISRESNKTAKTITGTPNYMAPECYLKTSYTFKCDVYSFAIIIYEMFRGNLKTFAFLKSINATIYKFIAIDGNRPPIDFEMPSMVKDLIEKCWEHDEEKRLSFKEVYQILKDMKVNKERLVRHYSIDDVF